MMRAYFSRKVDNVEEFVRRLESLRKESHEYPISKVGRIWSYYAMKRNKASLNWIYEKCAE